MTRGSPTRRGRARRPEAPAHATAGASPGALPGVPEPAPVPGPPGAASGPCLAGPRGPGPGPCPPPPPPFLPAPAHHAWRRGPWVRSLRRASGTVRRPVSRRPGVPLTGPMRSAAASGTAGHRSSRVPPTLLPCRPGVFAPAGSEAPRPSGAPSVACRVCEARRPPSRPCAGLPTRPARSPGHAARTPLPGPAPDSGPAWWARPSLWETCTPSHRAGLSRRIPNAQA